MRRVRGQQILSLRDEDNGSVAMPREWTDQAPPSPYDNALEQAPVLSVASLLKLQELGQLIKKGVDDAE